MKYKSLKRQISRLMRSTLIVDTVYDTKYPNDTISQESSKYPKKLINGKTLYSMITNPSILHYIEKLYNGVINIDKIRGLFSEECGYYYNQNYFLVLYISNNIYQPVLEFDWTDEHYGRGEMLF